MKIHNIHSIYSPPSVRFDLFSVESLMLLLELCHNNPVKYKKETNEAKTVVKAAEGMINKQL